MAGDLTSPAVGEYVAHYQLVELLGRDNGSHFSAIDTRTNRVVRLTVSLGRFSPAEIRGHLARAKAATAISHPNVATVFEVGESEQRLFVASELVRSKTLEEVLGEKGSLPTRLAADVARQIASGVSAAHAQGVLHLGLRPGNVFLGSSVKVIDFGTDIVLGGHGRAFATPLLMAPEQVSGSTAKPDARTDVYSLGALLFQLLAGVPPFSGKSLAEIVQGILQKSPPRLQALKPRAAPLEAIVNRALEKKPERRFQTMSELAAALGEVLRAPVDEMEGHTPNRHLITDLDATARPDPQSIPKHESAGRRAQDTWGVEPFADSAAILPFPSVPPLAAPPSTQPTHRADSSAMTFASEGERPRITREVGLNVPVSQPERPRTPLTADKVSNRRWLWLLLVIAICLVIAGLVFAFSAYFAELEPTRHLLLAWTAPVLGGGKGRGRR